MLVIMSISSFLSLRLLCASGVIFMAAHSFAQVPTKEPSKDGGNPPAQANDSASKAQRDQALAESIANLKKQSKALQGSVTALQATKAKQQDDAVKAKESREIPDSKPISPKQPAAATEPAAEPASEPATDLLPTDQPAAEPEEEPAADLAPTDQPAAEPEEEPAADLAPTDQPAAEPEEEPAAEPVPTDESAPTAEPGPMDDAKSILRAQQKILTEMKAQSKALEERVKALESLVERQNLELAKARAQKTSKPTQPTGVRAKETEQDTTEAALENDPEIVSPISNDSHDSEKKLHGNQPFQALISNPFESPETLLVEMSQRYAERFGTTPTVTPDRTLDFDDFSITLRKWAVAQNRILCQSINWSVTVLRTEPSQKASDKIILTCQAVDANGSNVGDSFHAEIDRSPTSELVRSSPKGTIFQLVGDIDPRIDFSAEHETDRSWNRSGTFVAPYCVSHWVIIGKELTSNTAPSVE